MDHTGIQIENSTSDGSIFSPHPKENDLNQLPLVGKREVGGGSNVVMLVDLHSDGSAIFKPGKGEWCLEIQESCQKLYQRERAAYLVNHALKLGLVPPTVVRNVDGQAGSVQEFVPNTSSLYSVDRLDSLSEQLYLLAIFDYIIWNKDRGYKNTLVQNNRIVAIDNGLSFDEWWEYLISDNLKSYVYGRSVPSQLTENLRNFLENPSQQHFLRQALSELVPARTINAMFARMKQVSQLLSNKGRIERSDENSFIYYPSSTL